MGEPIVQAIDQGNITKIELTKAVAPVMIEFLEAANKAEKTKIEQKLFNELCTNDSNTAVEKNIKCSAPMLPTPQ